MPTSKWWTALSIGHRSRDLAQPLVYVAYLYGSESLGLLIIRGFIDRNLLFLITCDLLVGSFCYLGMLRVAENDEVFSFRHRLYMIVVGE